MKTTNIKTLIIIALLSIFITSCTELNSDEDKLLENNTIENTQAGGCEGKKC